MARPRKVNRKTAPRKSNGASPLVDDAADITADDLSTDEGATSTGGVVRRRRFNWKIALLVFGVLTVLAAGGLVGYFYWEFNHRLASESGTVSFPGLSAPVTITRDQYGVPHITAATMNDAYAAEGYVHAQDRLFEMWFFRAYMQGRLAELLDARALDIDKFWRAVGLYRAAQAELPQLSQGARDALQAYSNGVNQFVHTHQDTLPMEFYFIGAKFEDWQPIDSIAFGKLEAWDLTQDWSNELVAYDMQKTVGADKQSELMPNYPSTGPSIVSGANSGYFQRVLDEYDSRIKPLLLNLGGEGLGSNNWVIDGTKSATGKPMLANDPHLALRNPSVWYQIQLSTTDGKLDMVGFSFPSAPGVITGHNRNIAWGVTNVSGDVQDVYLEKVDPSGHPNQYQDGDKWVPFQLITETIKVKDSDPVTFTVRLTERGPLISDSFTPDDMLAQAVGQPFSMQWTALQPGHLFDAVFQLQTASNWTEFRAALSKWDVPGQNFVYADQQGNIGYQMTGLYPIRKKGEGRLPVPGYTGEYGWSGTVAFDDLPRAYNPPDHFIATANNRPFPADSKLPITGDFSPPWRIDRITQMLKAKDKLSADDIKAMQLDTHSEMAKDLSPIIAALPVNDPATKQVTGLFKDWDGDLTANSPLASVYEVMIQNVLTQTLSDDLGVQLLGSYLDNSDTQAYQAVQNLMHKPDDPLWDRKDTPQVEKRDDIVMLALTNTLQGLQSAYGNNIQDWTWGKLHTLTPSHLLGDQPVIGGLFNLSAQPIGGDNTTVSAAAFSLVNPFGVVRHQSYRMIIDLSNWSNSLAIYPNGQSGQPGSKHFGDFLQTYAHGDYNPLLFSSADIDAKKEAVLTLQP